MMYKLSITFLLMFGLLTAFKNFQQPAAIKFGEYQTTYNGLKYIIELKSDSSFQYKKIQKWPVEFTYGKWRIEKNILILNSVADTLKFRTGRYSGTHVFFENQKYIFKNDKITEKKNPVMKYSLNDSTIKSL